jgi:hypothetical protein
MSKDDDEEEGVAIDVVIAAITARGKTRGDHVVAATAPRCLPAHWDIVVIGHCCSLSPGDKDNKDNSTNYVSLLFLTVMHFLFLYNYLN